MSAMPKPVPSESDVDAVLAKIDKCLPKIHKRAADAKKSGDTPSGTFSPEQLKRTRQEFQAMSEESLLTGSGEDIKVPEEGAEATETPKAKANGVHPHPPSPAKRTLFFRRGP